MLCNQTEYYQLIEERNQAVEYNGRNRCLPRDDCNSYAGLWSLELRNLAKMIDA
jgi:hypothetical protein